MRNGTVHKQFGGLQKQVIIYMANAQIFYSLIIVYKGIGKSVKMRQGLSSQK